MNLTRYSSALLPLLVGVLGILEAARSAGTSTLLDWQTITQIALLLAGTGVVYWLPLVGERWQGAAKTGAAIGFAVVSAVVAIVPEGHVTKANLILVLTAVVKAVATELGVQIRTDAAKTIDATATAAGQVPVVTTLDAGTLLGMLTPPAAATNAAPGEPATFEEALRSAAPIDEADDAPKHLAGSQ